MRSRTCKDEHRWSQSIDQLLHYQVDDMGQVVKMLSVCVPPHAMFDIQYFRQFSSHSIRGDAKQFVCAIEKQERIHNQLGHVGTSVGGLKLDEIE